MNFSITNRPLLIQQAKTSPIDLIIIGGGVTGVGIALDAALKGIKTVLIEKNDFASGTSSRSTKLIHGGLRYLKQLEFKLVKDVGSERAVVYKNALHIVRPERMLLPIIENGSLGKPSTSLGLWVYDKLAGVKKTEQRQMLSKEETQTLEPLLNKSKLIGGSVYYEYRTDDARLVAELAKSATSEGAICLNYCLADSFLYDASGKINGIEVFDKLSGEKLSIKAPCVVNATGPGVDLVRKKDNSLFGKRLQLTKGVHLVFPFQKLPLNQAVYFDVADGRMIFAIPRGGITYVGTTDTVYNQDIDHPLVSKADAKYVLDATNNMFPSANLSEADIESSWAGLRPLIHEEGKGPSELSRKDEIIVSSSGLISIAGGKLTGYRLMAEKIIQLVGAQIGKIPNRTNSTKKQKLAGGDFDNENAFADFIAGLEKEAGAFATKWASRYGSNATWISQNYQSKLATEKDPDLAALYAEIDYCIEHEMICKLDDFVVRRSGMLYFEMPLLKKYFFAIADYLHAKLGWTDAQKVDEIANVQRQIKEATHFE